MGDIVRKKVKGMEERKQVIIKGIIEALSRPQDGGGPPPT